MKYWLLTSEFPPSYGGGISTYCQETARMMAAADYEVLIITDDYKVNHLIIEQQEKYKVARFHPNRYYTQSFLGFEANLSYAFAQVVKEIIEKEGIPDVIESQEYLGIAYYLLQYKYLQYPYYKDLKIVLTLHAPSFLYLEYNKVNTYQHPYFWIGEMEKFCIKSADLLISPSQYLIEAIKSRIDLAEKKIHVIKNPYQVTGEKICPIQKGKIIFFGKLTPQKGCLELLDYFRKLWNDGFEHSLIMIGGGNHLYHVEGIDMVDFIKKKYKTEIENKKLKLIGSIPPSQLDKHLEDAHVIVIPSTIDNLPYTVLEAMSIGKIVLASMQGGQSEIIKTGDDGFLFDHKIKNSFQSQLKKIISLSEEKIKIISKNAGNKIKEEYSYEKIYKQKLELLNELLNDGPQNSVFPFLHPCNAKTHVSNQPINNKGLLSVVIPYFNMGKFVEDTIISLKNSTYKDIEIIIVNDGSNEAESITKLEDLNNRFNIKIINKENEGLSLARNTGALQAAGEFLAFLDPDDTIEPEYYEKAIKVLKKYDNVFFVGCWAKYFGASKGYWPAFTPEPPYLLVHNMINSSALIYKKQSFIISGLNDPEMIFGMEDYESVIKMVSNGFSGVVLPEPLWNYRIRKDSMVRAFTKNKQLYLYRLIAKKHIEFFSIFATDIINLINTNGPGINYDNPTLLYDFPGKYFISGKLKRIIFSMVKSNVLLRRIAIKVKKIIR